MEQYLYFFTSYGEVYRHRFTDEELQEMESPEYELDSYNYLVDVISERYGLDLSNGCYTFSTESNVTDF